MFVLPDDYVATYAKLLRCFAPPKASEPKKFCAFAPLQGREWPGDIIFYGRALNGWPTAFTCVEVADEQYSRKLAGDVCRLGSSQSICDVDKDALCGPPPCEHEDRQMHWVHHRRQKTKWRYSSVAIGCPCWRVLGRVIRKYHGLNSASEEWASRVAWSNLYKIAPKDGGNPNQDEMAEQLEVCKELLIKELTLWRPKAAVFLTETKRRSANFVFKDIDDEWFGKYRSRFPFDKDKELRPTRSDGSSLVHSGTAKIGNEEVRIIVALRPVSLPRDELCEEILGALRD